MILAKTVATMIEISLIELFNRKLNKVKSDKSKTKEIPAEIMYFKNTLYFFIKLITAFILIYPSYVLV